MPGAESSWLRGRRRLAATLVGLAVALVAVTVVVIASSGRGNSHPVAEGRIAAVAYQPQYAAQFGGIEMDGAEAIVNVTPNSSALKSALAAKFPSGSYTLRTVSTSLATLEADTMRIARDPAMNAYAPVRKGPFAVVTMAPMGNGTVQTSVIGNLSVAKKTLTSLYPDVPLSFVAYKGPLPKPIP